MAVKRMDNILIIVDDLDDAPTAPNLRQRR